MTQVDSEIDLALGKGSRHIGMNRCGVSLGAEVFFVRRHKNTSDAPPIKPRRQDPTTRRMRAVLP